MGFGPIRPSVRVLRNPSLSPAGAVRTHMQGRRLFGFRDETRIEGTLARDLYIARNRPAKDFGRAFPMSIRAAVHAGFSNGRGTIRDEGYEISIRPGRADMRTYEIRYVPT